MIITISGTPGSGKSTIAKRLVNELSLERSYAGGIFRKLARDRGMAVEEMLEFIKSHPEIDKQIDKMVSEEARHFEAEGKSVVVEGRVQYHFLPESFKLFIKVDQKEAAKRIFKDLQNKEAQQARNEKVVETVEEVERKTTTRENKDVKRYEELYGTNYLDETHYDVVVDTTHMSIDKAVETIKNLIQEHKNKKASD